MRLLSFEGDGNLTWTEFNQEIPPYGILSHRWESEEVTFVDLVNGTAESKAGYRKIEFCGEQALRDKLQYFWVDSCCIDKRNNTELTKAINSMFRWYQNAVKCYVYLSDVHHAGVRRNVWEAEFRKSIWFGRGWTLQELLAPACVEFYSSRHQWIGDKESLCPIIHDVTKIPVSALRGQPLETFSIEERMMWAEKRQTTEDEDGAYCMLGIFNVFIPLIYGEGKRSALKRLQRELDGLPSSASTCFTVPFERNPRFSGRESLMANLESKLFVGEQTTRTAIVGLGGIGKTQIALELAYRTQSKYKNCSVFWIPVMDMDGFHQAYRDIAQQLQIPGCDEEKADFKNLVKRYLSEEFTRPWLCIFDNVDDLSVCGDLKDYLPKSKQGCVIFTTRDKQVAVKLAGGDVIEVPELDGNGGVQLLRMSLIDPSLIGDQRDARALVKQLNNLPLAIAQGAAYINKNSITLRDYLSLLNTQEGDVIELLSEDFEDDYRYPASRNPVATTWLVSFEQVRRRDPLAADYLSFMACIDRKDIPKSLLPPGPSQRREMEAIGTLKAYSFIVQRSEEMVFDLHRLVHLVSRSWLRKERTLSEWSKKAIERLSDIFPESDFQNRMQWRMLQPHAAYALRAAVVEQGDTQKSSLTFKYAKSLLEDGRYREAEKPFEELIAVWERTRGDGDPDPDTLDSMALLSTAYRDQGRYQEAEDLGIRVIEMSIRVLGEEHRDTLTSMDDLSYTYTDQGRLKEAEELCVRVEKIKLRVLGEDHPETLTSMNNLASIYWEQGRLKEAEKLGMRVRDIRTRLFGEEHPHTLTTMHNLATTYAEQGRLRKAEELLVRVMKLRSKLLGADHPQTLSTMHHLALLRKSQRLDAEAFDLLNECVQMKTRVLGVEHPDTISAKESLADWRMEGSKTNDITSAPKKHRIRSSFGMKLWKRRN